MVHLVGSLPKILLILYPKFRIDAAAAVAAVAVGLSHNKSKGALQEEWPTLKGYKMGSTKWETLK